MFSTSRIQSLSFKNAFPALSISVTTMAPAKKLVAKRGKKEKQDLSSPLMAPTHPAEDGGMGATSFERFPRERIKVNGNVAGNLGGGF